MTAEEHCTVCILNILLICSKMSSPKTRKGTSASCAGLYSIISNDKRNTSSKDFVPASFHVYPQFSLDGPRPRSNEPDRFSRQRSAEAPGGGAFQRGDDRPHQPGVHPDPGGADRAAGATEEEDSAGEGVSAVSPVKC